MTVPLDLLSTSTLHFRGYDMDWKMVNCSPAHVRMFLFLAASLVFLFILLILGRGWGGANGETIIVDDNGPADFPKIQWAIDNATDGDTVRVYDGWYNESLIINRSVSIIGNGSESTILNGTGNPNYFRNIITITANDTNVSGFTFTSGPSSSYFQVIEVNSCMITDNLFSCICLAEA